MRRRITWIASYPKSGNTWVRALLLNYLAPPGSTVAINDIKAIPIASSRQLFDQALGCESELLLPHEIPSLRSAWYDDVANRQPGHFFKVHDQYNPALHTPANSSLVLYIVRNPWDVAVSYAAHRGKSIAETIALLENVNYVAALSRGERKPQLTPVLWLLVHACFLLARPDRHTRPSHPLRRPPRQPLPHLRRPAASLRLLHQRSPPAYRHRSLLFQEPARPGRRLRLP
jgi:hypothetical protein